MKKLLLIALVGGGLTFAAAPRSEAQVFFSIGFGPGYGYYPYGYYPYRYYYRPYYWYGGHRHYRHHHRYHHRY